MITILDKSFTLVFNALGILQLESHSFIEMPAFRHFEHALRTSHKPAASSAFAEVFGCEMWDYFKDNPEKQKCFSRGMKSCDALGNVWTYCMWSSPQAFARHIEIAVQ